ncbi:MAG: GNAT family N-acetyltransferase [Oscillospiraceae bacterium]|jgi:GNAT superfamily N-acetyltransferase|nr:GNAT family N-acetyltransferase [Oscillospiraceae bacterium]
MEIAIREGVLTPDTFAGLRAACGMPELEPVLIERALENSLATFAAVCGARTVGMARLVGDGAFVFLLCDLLVVPLWRHQGIGSLLTETVVNRAKSCVPPGRAVVVSLFSAAGREGFYTRLGFAELPVTGLGAGMQMFCL